MVHTKNLVGGFQSSWHAHLFYELGVVFEGVCVWRLRNRTVRRLRAGEMILVPPKCDHFETTESRVRLGWVGFVHAEKAGNASRAIRQARDETGDIQYLLQHLAREQDSPEICGLTLQHILLLFRRAEKHGNQAVPKQTHSLNARQIQIVQSVAGYLDHNAGQRLSMEQVADYHKLSAHHLNILFQRYYRMTPTNYRLRQRMTSAEALLQEGVSIKEIAAECGFTDAAHFSREFKLRTGKTPGEARNSLGG